MKKTWVFIWIFMSLYCLIAGIEAKSTQLVIAAFICGFMVARVIADIARK